MKLTGQSSVVEHEPSRLVTVRDLSAEDSSVSLGSTAQGEDHYRLTFVYFIRYPRWTPTLPSAWLLKFAFWLLLAASSDVERRGKRSERSAPSGELVKRPSVASLLTSRIRAPSDRPHSAGLTLLEQIAHVVSCADSLLSVERALALAVSYEHICAPLEGELADDGEVLAPDGLVEEGRPRLVVERVEVQDRSPGRLEDFENLG